MKRSGRSCLALLCVAATCWSPFDLDPSSARELAALEAFFTENRPALRRAERHRGFLAARRAVGGCLDALSHHRACRRPVCSFCLTCLAALRFVLELFVGEKQLLARSPYEVCAAVYAPQGFVLELHRSPPLLVAVPAPGPGTYSSSRRSFFRFRFRARACFARRLSPGFR